MKGGTFCLGTNLISRTLAIESQTTTLPTGSSDQETVDFDTFGLPAWRTDAGGYSHYAACDA